MSLQTTFLPNLHVLMEFKQYILKLLKLVEFYHFNLISLELGLKRLFL